MKTEKHIFSKLGMGIILCSVFFFGAYANDGCDDEKNEYINQNLALCSVHAYNISAKPNPTTPAQRQLMQDAIALKTTVMTQQMKKQYDFLDVTVKRFKVQLEKAILTAQAQAAGAPEGSSVGMGGGGGSSSRSTDRDIVISGAQNCGLINGTKEAMNCLLGNLRLVQSESSTNTARRQLEKDLEVFKLYDHDGHASLTNDKGVCKSANIQNNKEGIIKCASSVRVMINRAIEQYDKERMGRAYN